RADRPRYSLFRWSYHHSRCSYRPPRWHPFLMCSRSDAAVARYALLSRDEGRPSAASGPAIAPPSGPSVNPVRGVGADDGAARADGDGPDRRVGPESGVADVRGVRPDGRIAEFRGPRSLDGEGPDGGVGQCRRGRETRATRRRVGAGRGGGRGVTRAARARDACSPSSWRGSGGRTGTRSCRPWVHRVTPPTPRAP